MADLDLKLAFIISGSEVVRIEVNLSQASCGNCYLKLLEATAIYLPPTKKLCLQGELEV